EEAREPVALSEADDPDQTTSADASPARKHKLPGTRSASRKGRTSAGESLLESTTEVEEEPEANDSDHLPPAPAGDLPPQDVSPDAPDIEPVPTVAEQVAAWYRFTLENRRAFLNELMTVPENADLINEVVEAHRQANSSGSNPVAGT